MISFVYFCSFNKPLIKIKIYLRNSMRTLVGNDFFSQSHGSPNYIYFFIF